MQNLDRHSEPHLDPWPEPADEPFFDGEWSESSLAPELAPEPEPDSNPNEPDVRPSSAPHPGRHALPFLMPLVRSAPRPSEQGWSLEALAGRTIELSTPAHGPAAAMTAAASLLIECQLRGEPVAWVAAGGATFHPGDLAEAGADLAALPVVRARDAVTAARAADRLLRSGGLGLLVLDLVEAKGTLDAASLTRLAGLARHHQSVLLALTQKSGDATSLGSLVSLRAKASVTQDDFDHFEWSLRVVKDKRSGPGWSHVEVCRGPDGLC